MLNYLLVFYRRDLNQKLREDFIQDFEKADKVILGAIVAYAVLVSCVTSFQYGYFMLGIVGGGAIAALSFFTYKLLKGTLLSRLTMATALTGMMAITIQQSNGLGEGHFLFFLNFAILIRYRDVLPLVLLVLLTVVHHLLTSYCQYYGIEVGNTPITVFSWGMETEWGLFAPLVYHVILALIGAAVATYYIYEGNISFLENRSVIAAIERAAEGELTVRAESHSNSELVSRVNRFLRGLNEFFVMVSDISKTLRDESTLSAEVAKHSESQAHMQEAQIAQVATSMDEMSATTQEIANNAEYAAQSISQASQSCNSGRDLSSNFKVAIERLANRVSVAAENIAELEKSSAQIHSIVATIRGISEQTNLLALNAAIEAARAGEQGRGFAVVADEVRVLSQATHGSTEEISAMIDAFQSSTNSAVRNMRECTELTETSVSDANTVAVSFDELSRSIKSIGDMAAQIASAAEQQTMGTNEINRNTSDIKDVAESFLSDAGLSRQKAEKLSQLSHDIDSLLQKYQLH
ncbi:methyl-accepting chemotaxis protein [Paraneptunicella aestuarii]|uniref:methyl-accepting chemotaxis protein n=1 Tax=Paraneptunicella aestuarii TaxID=2831148 RepID=UPI001E4ACA61|nr:methyl-accepting chemotaxis protein [Paraneptunicella aestuarii]UAA40531.1 methyl-accepting chemotaxis protein [Paraneptunicella aestuarii]